jgi:hypothetical protein
MTLVGFDGRRTSTSIPFPRGDTFPTSDAAGYLLFQLTGGVYRATPEGLRRVTSGQVLAAGPTRWLTLECDSRHKLHADGHRPGHRTSALTAGGDFSVQRRGHLARRPHGRGVPR